MIYYYNKNRVDFRRWLSAVLACATPLSHEDEADILLVVANMIERNACGQVMTREQLQRIELTTIGQCKAEEA